jgi:hypothetical protein
MALLVPCPACARHVRKSERACPFCAASLTPDVTAGRAAKGPRLGRAATFAFGAAVATSIAACSSPTTGGTDAATANDSGDGADAASPIDVGTGNDAATSPDAASGVDSGGGGNDAGEEPDTGGIKPPYGAPPGDDAGGAAPLYGGPPP